MAFSINILIDQKLLHIPTNSPSVHELTLGLHRFKSSAKIFGVSVTKDFVILETYEISEDQVDLNKAHPKVRTTIDAYDWECNHLWNIADIIGDSETRIYGGTVSAKHYIKDHPDFDESKYDDTSELYCCHANNHVHVIDLNSRTVIQALVTK